MLPPHSCPALLLLRRPLLQDDEALLLYSIVRGLRFSSVLEIGGLRGYSARNFLQAMHPTQGEGPAGVGTALPP